MLVLGDIQYEDGARDAFEASYDASWGRVKRARDRFPAITSTARPVPPVTSSTSARRAGDPAKGYYSFELGDWHVVALNSNCAASVAATPDRAQEHWLRADLAAHPARCTLAYWHHPRYSSG